MKLPLFRAKLSRKTWNTEAKRLHVSDDPLTSAVSGCSKPTDITGGHHPVYMYIYIYKDIDIDRDRYDIDINRYDIDIYRYIDIDIDR